MSACEEMKTPYYLIDVSKIKENYLLFKNAILRNGRKDIIAYSIKANYDKQIILALAKMGAYFEVCTDFEFDIIKKLGIDTRRVIMNGISINQEIMMNHIKSNAMVIIDSKSQLEWLRNIDHPIQIGLRLNLDYLKKDDSLYRNKQSRFGIDISSNAILNYLRENSNIQVVCLQCHFSGNTRHPVIYSQIVFELCRIIRENELSTVRIIDVGGGYKIAPHFWTYNDYVNEVSKTLAKISMTDLTVIYEPGNSLVRRGGTYSVKIIDKKDLNGIRYLVVDGTRLHISPNNARENYQYRIENNGTDVIAKQIIVGCTCKESDIILELENCFGLEIGNIISIDNIGAYVMNEISEFLVDKPYIYYA